ncbi:TPA: PRD domain-containing protein [Enterococcus faecalis]|nr:PRD domain-containing protein [Enterococcus faecalis]HBD0935152.1 PRD domain-containing protein [Enterococcus faecalis]
MIIHKILNNNVVITLDDDKREQIVMGKGIAFKKRIGDWVPDESIDQVFYLANQETSLKFQELLGNIPLEMMKLSDDIIVYAKSTLKKSLNDTIYISLTDHLYTALERKKQGIAIHLVNAEMEEEVGNIYELTKLMQEITNIVKYYFKVSFDEDSVYFYRFSTHLKFFCYRLLHQREVVENDDEELYAVIKKKYLNAYRCVEKISLYLNENYDYQVSNEERLYLTIHIARIVQTTEQ